MSVQKLKISPATVITDNKTVKADKIVGVSKFLISPVFNFLHSTFDGFWKMFTTTAGWICVGFLSCLTKQRILHITHMHRSIFPPIST